MREFDVRQLTEAVSAMVQDVNYRYPADVKHCLDSACEKETSRIGKATLEYLKLNAAIADEKHIPICQDTGMVVVYRMSVKMCILLMVRSMRQFRKVCVRAMIRAI